MNMHVLEIGSGESPISQIDSMRGVTLTHLEPSQYAVDESAWNMELRHNDVPFVLTRADASNMPFPAGTFSRVYARNVFSDGLLGTDAFEVYGFHRPKTAEGLFALQMAFESLSMEEKRAIIERQRNAEVIANALKERILADVHRVLTDDGILVIEESLDQSLGENIAIVRGFIAGIVGLSINEEGHSIIPTPNGAFEVAELGYDRKFHFSSSWTSDSHVIVFKKIA